MKHIDKRLTNIDAEKRVHIVYQFLPLFANFTDNQLKRFQNKLISYDPQGMRAELLKGQKEGSERIALTILILGKRNLDAVFSSLVEFFYATRVATHGMTDKDLERFSAGPFGLICGKLDSNRNRDKFKDEFLARNEDGSYKLSIYDQANLYINETGLVTGVGDHQWYALQVALCARAIINSEQIDILDTMTQLMDGDAAIKIAEEIVDSLPEHDPQWI